MYVNMRIQILITYTGAGRTPPAASDFAHAVSSADVGVGRSGDIGAARKAPHTWQQICGHGPGEVTLQIVGPDGRKGDLKIRLTDDVATLRALVTQMYALCTCCLYCFVKILLFACVVCRATADAATLQI